MARPSKPWFDSEKKAFFCTITGIRYPLGPDRAEAHRKFHELMAGTGRKEADPTVVPPFDRVVQEYLAQLPLRANPASCHTARCYLKPFSAQFGRKKVNAVTPAEVKAAAEGHVAWGPIGRRMAYSRLSCLFNWAVREHPEWKCSNPAKKIKWPPPRSRGADSIPTPEEFQKLLDNVPPHVRDILIAIFETGARPSEVLRVTAADYHRDSAVWILNEHKTDGSAGRRVIHLRRKVVWICDRLKEKYPTGALFRTRYGRPYKSSKELASTVRRVRRRLGLRPSLVVYGLRHGFATSLLSAGESEVVVAALLGHKGTRVLGMHYSHVDRNSNLLRAALERREGSSPAAGPIDPLMHPPVDGLALTLPGPP